MKQPGVRWKAAVSIVVLAAATAAAVRRFRDKPLEVELATVREGALRVTVDEDGYTQARDRFAIAAPITGRVSRIVLKEGDAVSAGQTVAFISPAPLDTRERSTAAARVAAAEAMLREAEQNALHAESDRDLAVRERQRIEALCRSGDLPQQKLDQAKTSETGAGLAAGAARHRVEAAQHEVEVARAALAASGASRESGTAAAAIAVRSPVSGRVLDLPEASERVVAAGTELMVLGDPRRLEVSIEVLSTDAVRIRPGAEVTLRQWGGDTPLRARVRSIDPHAFRKVSALGVEERRVHVIADLVDTPAGLGDGYKVEASIVAWEQANVLAAPAGALFRPASGSGGSGQWSAFVVRDGRAVLTPVTVGQITPDEMQILEGLNRNDVVVVRPPRALAPGMRVTAFGGTERAQ